MSIKINIINKTGLADSDIFLMLWGDTFTATLPAIKAKPATKNKPKKKAIPLRSLATEKSYALNTFNKVKGKDNTYTFETSAASAARIYFSLKKVLSDNKQPDGAISHSGDYHI